MQPSASSIPDFHRARALIDERRFDEAIVAVVEAVVPGAGKAALGAAAQQLRRIAREAERTGGLSVAVHAIEQALTLAAGFADLHFQHALLLVARGQRPEARRALGKALELNPGYLAARVELAMLDAREGLIGDALQALGDLQRHPGVREPAAFSRALDTLQQANWDEAGSLIRRALRLSDPAFDELFEKFHACMDDARPLEAALLIGEALPRHTGYPDLHFLLGTARFAAGQVDDAVVAFAHALELHPDFHAARLELARALEAQGQVAQARDQVALVLEACPGDPTALEMHERWSSRHRGVPARASARRKAS